MKSFHQWLEDRKLFNISDELKRNIIGLAKRGLNYYKIAEILRNNGFQVGSGAILHILNQWRRTKEEPVNKGGSAPDSQKRDWYNTISPKDVPLITNMIQQYKDQFGSEMLAQYIYTNFPKYKYDTIVSFVNRLVPKADPVGSPESVFNYGTGGGRRIFRSSRTMG